MNRSHVAEDPVLTLIELGDEEARWLPQRWDSAVKMARKHYLDILEELAFLRELDRAREST